MAKTGPGWERDRRNHFDDIVDIYNKARPEYPDKLFMDIFDYIGLSNCKKAVEVGAGTGKATLPFLDAEYNVTAVEISENMVDFMKVRFRCYKDFNTIVTAFEDAELEADSYDLVYAANAFHWVDAEIGCPKVMQLLKSGGVFALFRYNANPADGDDLYESIQKVYEQFYPKPYIRPVRKTYRDFEEPAEVYNSFRFNDLGAYGFTDISMMFYDGCQTFSADEYMAYLDTQSDHRVIPEDDRKALFSGVKEAIEAHGGYLTNDYIYQLYMGRRP